MDSSGGISIELPTGRIVFWRLRAPLNGVACIATQRKPQPRTRKARPPAKRRPRTHPGEQISHRKVAPRPPVGTANSTLPLACTPTAWSSRAASASRSRNQAYSRQTSTDDVQVGAATAFSMLPNTKSRHRRRDAFNTTANETPRARSRPGPVRVTEPPGEKEPEPTCGL